MAQSMIDKAIARARDRQWDAMAEIFHVKFGARIATRYNVFSGNYVTEQSDGRDMTPEQRNWVLGFEEGLAAFERALLLAQYQMRAQKPRTKN